MGLGIICIISEKHLAIRNAFIQPIVVINNNYYIIYGLNYK